MCECLNILGVKQLQSRDWGQGMPVVQESVYLCHAAPVPAGGASQHLGQTGYVLPTVEPLVPQELAVRSCQPRSRGGGEGGGRRGRGWREEIERGLI